MTSLDRNINSRNHNGIVGRHNQLLQENGYIILRFLAEGVARDLDSILDAILRSLARRAVIRLEPR